MELKIQIDEKDLAKLVGSQPIVCKGASQKSEGIAAFVQVIEAPRDGYQKGESYVLCPRLKRVFYSTEFHLRCYEGEPDKYEEIENKDKFDASRPCPYFNPDKK